MKLWRHKLKWAWKMRRQRWHQLLGHEIVFDNPSYEHGTWYKSDVCNCGTIWSEEW